MTDSTPLPPRDPSTPELPDLEAVHAALGQSDRGPLKAKELARALQIPTEAYRAFRDRLRAWERSGELYRNRSQRFAVPAGIHLVVGTLQVIRSGDGFVRPDDPVEKDVHIAQRDLDSAMDGDRVVVRIESRIPGRSPSGRLVKVLERARPTVVGRFQAARRFGFVSPLDRRVGRDILVPEGSSGAAKPGDIVVVRLTQFGDRRRNSVGEVEQVLGPMEAPGVDVLAILHGHGLPRAFPADVEADAEAASVRAMEVEGREDIRDLLVFTIDPSTARDHDDALSLRTLEGGDVEVGVHIADVSHFVRPGSPVDLEALRRGTSVYLVDQVVPMLPHLLSSDLCSLREGEDRLAFSIFIRLSAEGEVREHRYAETRLRCRHGLHYEQVQAILEGEETVSPEVDAAVRDLHQMAARLRERRRSRGSLDFDLPEARVVLDEEGIPIDIQRVVQLDSHRLIEDFMLLANEIVARDAVRRKISLPFRIHEPPPEEKVEELRTLLGPMGLAPGARGITPRHLQGVLDRVRGRPEESLVSTVVLRSMSRARYAPTNQGHFGLASKAYLHFTSPIRRYPDLVVHRIVKARLLARTPEPEGWGDTLAEICERASERERVAQQAERDSVEMKKIEYMRRHLGDDFEGTIAGVTSFGFFVLLDRVFVEGLVHVSTLGDDYYTFVREAWALVGDRNGRRFRIGDRVRVRVARADKEDRQIDFVLLDGGGREERGGASPPGRGGKGGGGRRGEAGGRKKAAKAERLKDRKPQGKDGTSKGKGSKQKVSRKVKTKKKAPKDGSGSSKAGTPEAGTRKERARPSGSKGGARGGRR